MEKAASGVAAEMRGHLEGLRGLGVEPYPRTFTRTHLSSEIGLAFDELEGAEVVIAGRLTAIRGHGKAGFADVADAGGKIQLYVRKDDTGEKTFAVWRLLDVGDIVGARGSVMRTKTGEISLRVTELIPLAKALRPLPEKWHGLRDVEQRSRHRHLDLIANRETRDTFEKRSRILSLTRSFLEQRGFVEVETPVLQPVYGGAFARPFTTHHHALGRDLYLRIADELYLKRLIIGGLERVYEIGKDFRNEGMDRTHSPEFTQLELYQAYADYNDMMALSEELMAGLAKETCGGTIVSYQGEEVDLSPPWRRLRVMDAVGDALGVEPAVDLETLSRAAVKAGVELPKPLRFGRLVEEILATLVEPRLQAPTFLVDYPKEISPLAKETPGDADVVERFEIFIRGLELGNSFTELNDPDEQRARFEYQVAQREEGDAEAHGMDEDFVCALEHAMPPTGGLGIGVDRLVMLLTDSRNIRDVILFPAMRPEE